STNRFCKQWGCAHLHLWLWRVRVAAAPAAPFAKSLHKRSNLTCANKCPSGAINTQVWKICRSLLWGVLSTAPARASTTILVLACPVLARFHPRLLMLMTSAL